MSSCLATDVAGKGTIVVGDAVQLFAGTRGDGSSEGNVRLARYL